MQKGSPSSAWDNVWRTAAVLDPQGDTFDNAVNRTKLEFMGPVLPTSGRAVEIGCGSAQLLAMVGKVAPLELHAVDNSQAALERVAKTAELGGTAIHAMLGDARALNLADNSFDLVLSGGLLEHFEDPIPVLREMVRILRPGGVFYADVVPRKFSLFRWREAKRMLRSQFLMPGVYESTLGRTWYEGAMAGLGCTQVRTRSCGVYLPRWAKSWIRVTGKLDGTPVADLLGWYFMVTAVKA